ncbi:MAG: hypothetical protein IKK98_01610 [Oscillospiraceae bacterium]|nr:hypothetical protein [Oscillospiraceae bacterium]
MVKPEKIELTAQEAAQFWDDLRKEADAVHRSERVFRLGEMTLRIIFHEKRIEEYALGQLKTALLPQGSGAELTVHCLVSDALWRRCGQLPDEHRACLWCGERRMLFNLDWDPSSFYGSDGQEVWLGWRELGEDLTGGWDTFSSAILPGCCGSEKPTCSTAAVSAPRGKASCFAAKAEAANLRSRRLACSAVWTMWRRITFC